VAAAVQGGVEKQVDSGVAVFRLWLLPVLDQARDRAIDFDRQAGRLGLIPGEALLRNVPPTDDLRQRMDAQQLGLIALGQRAKGHA
jgi:hypothetical protein